MLKILRNQTRRLISCQHQYFSQLDIYIYIKVTINSLKSQFCRNPVFLCFTKIQHFSFIGTFVRFYTKKMLLYLTINKCKQNTLHLDVILGLQKRKISFTWTFPFISFIAFIIEHAFYVVPSIATTEQLWQIEFVMCNPLCKS